MTQTRARQILQSLIQGTDPITGAELPRETVLQHADVLRALLAGLTALEQNSARAQRRAQLPGNVGQAWTTEEESRLLAAFRKGDSAIAIARQHGRTLRAIEARLEKLGLITAEQRTTRGGFTGVSDAPSRPGLARGAILGRKRAQRRSR
jgi:DNA-binding NarL/FixJ family response regulator